MKMFGYISGFSVMVILWIALLNATFGSNGDLLEYNHPLIIIAIYLILIASSTGLSIHFYKTVWKKWK